MKTIRHIPEPTRFDLMNAYAAALQVAAQRQVHHRVSFRSDYDDLRCKAMAELGISQALFPALLEMGPVELLGGVPTGWYLDAEFKVCHTEITKVIPKWKRALDKVAVYPHYYVSVEGADVEMFHTLQNVADAHQQDITVSI